MNNYNDSNPFLEEDWSETDKSAILSGLEDNGFYQARLISGSKSTYRTLHPDNLVVFNANIFTKEYGKLWYGDLDLTNDAVKLKEISNEFDIIFYVLSEMDGRFENENRTDIEKVSLWDTENGLSKRMKDYFNDNLLKKSM